MKEKPPRQKKFLAKAENILDISGGILRDLPTLTLYGSESAEIDNFKGLLDFSPSTLRINTSEHIVRIDGTNLTIAHMSDESITVKGQICNLSFE